MQQRDAVGNRLGMCVVNPSGAIHVDAFSVEVDLFILVIVVGGRSVIWRAFRPPQQAAHVCVRASFVVKSGRVSKAPLIIFV